MARARSFRRNVFRTVLVVALVPAAGGLLLATLLVQGVGTGSGTLGPWDSVAESGRALVEAARSGSPDDPEIQRLAEAHQDALSESVRQSRLYAFVADRAVQALPWAFVLSVLVLAGLSALAARRVSKRLGGPVGDLVEWTNLVARGESLPTREEDRRSFKEFRALREALRSMETELRRARVQEVEAAEVRAWSDVARRVAHELKNPLTPIRMGAASLVRSPDPTVRETGAMIREEVQRLDRMARDFSRFGRPPEGPPAPVDVGELLTRLMERHSGEEGTAPVTLDLEEPLAFVDGHHDALGRAILNLLVNAQEALQGQPGGKVHLAGRRAPGGVEILVRDNGPGVPEDVRAEIWRPDVTTRSRGSGLGLAMVRQTVLAHGGEVTLEEAPGSGAIFRVFLPARDGRPSEGERRPSTHDVDPPTRPGTGSATAEPEA